MQQSASGLAWGRPTRIAAASVLIGSIAVAAAWAAGGVIGSRADESAASVAGERFSAGAHAPPSSDGNAVGPADSGQVDGASFGQRPDRHRLANEPAMPVGPGGGACCLIGGTCMPAVDEPECDGFGGVFLPGEDCVTGACIGACCVDLDCVGETDAYSCVSAGRTFAGSGTTCLQDPCDAGIGACCFADGTCMDLSPDACDTAGATWQGAGTDCTDGLCVLGACCLPGQCLEVAQYECTSFGGAFVAAGVCANDPCDVLLDCPSNALYSQTRDQADLFTAYTSEADAFQRWDDFSGVAGTIEGVKFWGLELEFINPGFIDCDDPAAEFQISFHEDELGSPGAVVCSYTVNASRVDTGVDYQGTNLIEYVATLPAPCVLVNGWISIVGVGDPSCWFLWLSSPDGDQRHICDGCAGPQEDDVAFCLLGTAGGVFGACCDLTTGDCVDAVEIVDCIDVGLRFEPDTLCADLAPSCSPTTGACCFTDGSPCVIALPSDCVTAGGSWAGALAPCSACPAYGACCFDVGICSIETETDCTNQGLAWLGAGTSCEDCPTIPECPADTLYGQEANGPSDFIASTSEDSAGLRRFDDFTGVTGPIDTVTFWGVDLDFEGGNFLECTENDTTFEIAFHEDAAGVPGAMVCSYTVVATRTPTGLLYLGTEMNEYVATLPAPCVLVNGWVSIVGLGDPECWFLWMSSSLLGGSYCQGCMAEFDDADMAFCLQGTPGGVFGACCVDATAQCADGVEIDQCAGPGQRFVPDTLCADLVPPCGVILGACCFDDATCTIEMERDCIGSGGTWLGANALCSSCPCVVPCPPGAVLEGEPVCGPGYVDTFNGGCNSEPPVFSTISIGQTVCGTSGIFLDGVVEFGEYDWYELTLAETTELIWTADAEFVYQMVVGDGTGGCPGTGLASTANFECTPTQIEIELGPGVYWLIIGPAASTDEAVCGAKYTMTLETAPECLADFDDSGTVDTVDLLTLLAAWGPAGPPFDFEPPGGDGLVDVQDLLALLAAWGPC